MGEEIREGLKRKSFFGGTKKKIEVKSPTLLSFSQGHVQKQMKSNV